MNGSSVARKRVGSLSESFKASRSWFPGTPRNAAKSTLSEDAVSALLKMRAPALQRSASQVGVSNVPAWVKPLLWPFIALSAVGLVVSIWVHRGSRCWPKGRPRRLFLNAARRHLRSVVSRRAGGKQARQKHQSKEFVDGSVKRLAGMDAVHGVRLFRLCLPNFLIFLPHASKGGAGNGTPVMVWRGFSGHWMAFYSAALAILYSAAASTTTPVEPPGQSQA